MGRPSRRGELLASGIEVLHKNGYTGASVDSIVEAAGMQKGSFFGHFGSKDAFVSEAVKGYFDHWQQAAEVILNDTQRSAGQKLRDMIEAATRLARRDSYQFGCLIGNMSAEMSTVYDEVRQTLVTVFEQWSAAFEQVIRQGQGSGEFHADLDAASTARFVVNALQGTALRGKVDRSLLPLDDYLSHIERLLFKR